MQPVTDDALGRIKRTVLVSRPIATASWSMIQMLVRSRVLRPLNHNSKEFAR